MAVRHAREQGSRVLKDLQHAGLDDPAESDAALYTYAGPEIAVASTKAFLTQLVATQLFGMYLAQVRGNFFGDEIRGLVSDLASMPNKIDLVLDTMDPVRELARGLKDARSVLFLGRHVGYLVALEGAAETQRTRLHARRGFPPGTQARTDRTDRRWSAGDLRHAVAEGAFSSAMRR